MIVLFELFRDVREHFTIFDSHLAIILVRAMTNDPLLPAQRTGQTVAARSHVIVSTPRSPAHPPKSLHTTPLPRSVAECG